MSAPKFTPGPWQVMPEEVGCDYVRVRGTRLGTRYKVANACRPEVNSGSERCETRANAHLIAAAPDLYEELDRAVRYFTDAGSNREAWGEMVHEWQQTLAKARGETP